MPTAEARTPTSRAARYLAQLCDHAAAMGANRPAHAGHHAPDHPQVGAERTGADHGVITFGAAGRCVLTATPAELLARVEAADEPALSRIQQTLSADLERFGRRDGLTVVWTRPGTGAA